MFAFLILALAPGYKARASQQYHLQMESWILDPANPDTEEDPAGNVNSILIKN